LFFWQSGLSAYRAVPEQPLKAAFRNAQQKADFDNRINRARLAGAYSGYTEAEFKNYLSSIGLNVYEKQILPYEIGGEYHESEPTQSAKIIPFPLEGSA
jgi:hypothetical protein